MHLREKNREALPDWKTHILFKVHPVETIIELIIDLQFADNEEIARELEEFYGDIDALEYYPGLMLERPRPGSIFGESIVEMGAPFSLKGLMGNPICSPEYWKPSTFGGKVGFDIVNSATLKNLVCYNTKTCPHVAFSVPQEAQSQSTGSKGKTDEL